MKKQIYLSIVLMGFLVLIISTKSSFAGTPPMPQWQGAYGRGTSELFMNQVAMATDSSGHRHYCWVDISDNTLRYSKSSERNPTREYVVVNLYGADKFNDFDIAVKDDGKVFISWSTNIGLNLGCSSNPDYWMRRTLRYGHVTENAMDIDDSGNIHISHIVDDELYHAEYIWELNHLKLNYVNAFGAIPEHLEMVVDLAGTIHMVYYNASHHQIRYAARYKTGFVWINETVYTSPGWDSPYPDISIDTLGSVHISYIVNPYHFLPEIQNLYHATNESGSWISTFIDTWKNRRNNKSAIMVDSRDIPHVVYPKRYELKHAARLGGVWQKISTNQRIGTLKAGSIILSIDDSDHLHAVYSYEYSNPERETFNSVTTSPGLWRVGNLLSENANGKVSIVAVPGSNDTLKYAYTDKENRIMYGHYLVDPEMPPEVSRPIDADGENRNPVIGVDDEKTLHVFYEQNNGNLKYAHRLYDADEWIISDVDTGYRPSLFAEPSGRLHLSYVQVTNALKYAVKEPGALTWTFETVAENADMAYKINRVHVDSNNFVHIAYVDTYQRLIYAYKIPNAVDWKFIEVASDASGTSRLGMAVSGNGVVHFSYYDNQHHELRYAKYVSIIDQLEMTTIDSFAEGSKISSSMAMDQEGLVHISYFDNRIGALMYTNPGSDSQTILDNSGNSEGYDSDITITANGKIVVVYRGTGNTLKLTYANHFGSRLFSTFQYPDHFIQEDVGDIRMLEIITDKDLEHSIFKMVPATIGNQAGCVFLEYVRKPGHFLYQENGRIKLGSLASHPDPDRFLKDAAFRLTTPLWVSDSLNHMWCHVSLESFSKPKHYIRKVASELVLESNNTELFRKDATFKIQKPRDVVPDVKKVKAN